jgi:hypothetical protein
MNWTEDIPNLAIQRLENGNLRLEDKSFSEGAIVDVHPSQLLLMAERLGLVRDLSASEADMKRDLALYRRALLGIRDRAEQLHENIFSLSMQGREDMGIEVAQSAALADFASFICGEFEDYFVADPPKEARTTPKNGDVQEPQKRGSSVADTSGAQQAALI